MTAYYNEWNRKSAAALRQLIADGLIAPGDVDERSILDVTYDDIKHYTQCHFFAGIGGWSLALRMAGWPDDRPVWTGSCPCQPFSEAGGRLGLADERHLWPFWYDLIAQRGDGVLFGEQVDAAIRYGWLDLVRDDLEAIGHAIAAVGLPAACVGAPHIRQRLWFVADTSGQRLKQHAQCDGRSERSEQQAPRGHDVDGCGGWGVAQLGVALGDAERTRLPQRLGLPGVPGWALGTGARQAAIGAGLHVGASSMVKPSSERRERWEGPAQRGFIDRDDAGRDKGHDGPTGSHETDRAGGFWDSAIWIDCKDGKRRPIEPSIFPLAHGVPERVGLLHGSGNAIVPAVAAAFIQEYLVTRSVI